MRPILLTCVSLAMGTAVSPATAAPASPTAKGCEAPCILFVKFLGSGTGAVASTDGRLNCRAACDVGTDYADRVVLRAVPDSGSVMTGWTGECESVAAGECAVYMEITKTVYAVFDRAAEPPTPVEPPRADGPPPPPAIGSSSPPDARGCTLYGTGGPDMLLGTPGLDVVCGLGGADHVHGGGGADILLGDAGNDVLEGNGGDDRILGGPGADRLDGGSGRDDLRSRDGVRDRVVGGSGSDRVRADRRDRVSLAEKVSR